MKLYGRSWTRREIEARVGRIEALGGVARIAGTEGPEAGVEFVELRTGAGLRCRIVPSRALDISLAEFGGAPLSWQASPGEWPPAAFEDRDARWLRTYFGGLVTTCGLTQVGSPNVDEGEELGVHGRINHTPARQVAAEGAWHGDEYEMRVAGVVEETAVFGHSLRLRREIRARLGENVLHVRDRVENAGFAPAPHMILYHCNFGFPLLTEAARLRFPSRKVVPRDAAAAVESDPTAWLPPDPAFAERVYYHEALVADAAGWAAAEIHQPEFPVAAGVRRPLTVRLAWNTATLPNLVQWTMAGCGTHVLGIEPANCRVAGRAAERARGTLVMLAPGEQRTYELRLEVAVA